VSRKKLWPIWLAMVLMAAASWFGKWAQPTVRMADLHPRQPLVALLPERIGDWVQDRTTLNVPLPPDVAAQVKMIYTELAERSYVNAKGERMMVTIAYGRDQSDGFKVHRPEVCYAAQGFTVSKPHSAQLMAGPRAMDVVHVETSMDERFEPVTYWMVIGDHVVNSPAVHKYYQIRYAFDGLIADGLLVRVSSFSKDAPAAYEAQSSFVRDWMSMVPAADRPRLFGS
jgi:EpsI family protein